MTSPGEAWGSRERDREDAHARSVSLVVCERAQQTLSGISPTWWSKVARIDLLKEISVWPAKYFARKPAQIAAPAPIATHRGMICARGREKGVMMSCVFCSAARQGESRGREPIGRRWRAEDGSLRCKMAESQPPCAPRQATGRGAGGAAEKRTAGLYQIFLTLPL